MIVIPKVRLFVQEGLSPAQAARVRDIVSTQPPRLTPLMRARALRDLAAVAPLRCACCRTAGCVHEEIADLERGAVLS